MADHSDHDIPDDGGVHVHVHSPKFYGGILSALLFLTCLTVASSYVDIDGLVALGRPVEGVGAWNLGVAILIATTKASLVVLFFMHLKEDKRFNALVFVGAILFAGVFFALTLGDTATRGLTGDRYNGVTIDPDTGLRAPGGVPGPIVGEVLEEGLAVAPPDGAALFTAICGACHTIGGGVLVGPDLAGVTSRRTEAWLLSFISSSQTMIASGDETAVALFEQFNRTPMPDVAYSEAQIRAVLAHIETVGGSATAAPGGEAVEDIVDAILGDDTEEPVDEPPADTFIEDILNDGEEPVVVEELAPPEPTPDPVR